MDSSQERGKASCDRKTTILYYFIDPSGFTEIGSSCESCSSHSKIRASNSDAEIIDEFPELTGTDIRACLEFAADRELGENCLKLRCRLD
ncbi:MAG: DUF433 domain-containing protein [Coleofasciculus chthonoplastes F3-SA18-01]